MLPEVGEKYYSKMAKYDQKVGDLKNIDTCSLVTKKWGLFEEEKRLCHARKKSRIHHNIYLILCMAFFRKKFWQPCSVFTSLWVMQQRSPDDDQLDSIIFPPPWPTFLMVIFRKSSSGNSACHVIISLRFPSM